MANIITMIENQIKKGNTLILADGSFSSPEKVEAICKKSYKRGIARDEIAVDISYSDYYNNVIENDVTHIEYLLAKIKEVIYTGEEATEAIEKQPEQPEQSE